MTILITVLITLVVAGLIGGFVSAFGYDAEAASNYNAIQFVVGLFGLVIIGLMKLGSLWL